MDLIISLHIQTGEKLPKVLVLFSKTILHFQKKFFNYDKNSYISFHFDNQQNFTFLTEIFCVC